MNIPDELLAQFVADAERCCPHEACGLFTGADGKAESFIACANYQDKLHKLDPVRYPRTAATAYTIDSAEQESVARNAHACGWKIIAIAHSHPEHDAYFSAEDRLNAAPWGEPLFPGVVYIVASVYGGKVRDIREYAWDEALKDFVVAVIR